MQSETAGKAGDNGTDSPLQGGNEVTNQEPTGASERESPDAESGAADETVPEGVVFDILRNERRRRVLKHLDKQDGRTTLGEMAESLAAIENDKPRSQITSQERKRLYVGLYQCHLPRMDKAEAIEFDGDRGTIERTEHTESFLEYLPTDDSGHERDNRWISYYLAISTVGAGLLVINVVGGLGGIVGAQLLLGAVVSAVGLCSIVHWYDTDEETTSSSDAS